MAPNTIIIEKELDMLQAHFEAGLSTIATLRKKVLGEKSSGAPSGGGLSATELAKISARRQKTINKRLKSKK